MRQDDKDTTQLGKREFPRNLQAGPAEHPAAGALKPEQVSPVPRRAGPQSFRFSRLGVEVRIFVSNKGPRDAAAGPRTKLREPLLNGNSQKGKRPGPWAPAAPPPNKSIMEDGSREILETTLQNDRLLRAPCEPAPQHQCPADFLPPTDEGGAGAGARAFPQRRGGKRWVSAERH